MTKDAKWVERWEKQRAVGRKGFILRSGALGYGLPMFIAMTFFVIRPALNVRSILLHAFIWIAAGLVFGAAIWSFSEQRYEKHRRMLSEGERGT